MDKQTDPRPKPSDPIPEVAEDLRDVQPMLLVESALFSAGRPLSEEEIADSTGMELPLVGLYLKKLSQVYSRRDTSLEIIKAGRKHMMRVKEQFVPKVSPLADPEIPPRLIKTAALIAYHQPMKQSDLVDMYGQKVYDHVKELMKLGLVLSRKEGSTRVLTTTQRFAEVFGIGAISKKKVKGYVRDRALEKVEKISKMTLDRFEEAGSDTESSSKAEDGAAAHVEGDEDKAGSENV
jgi:segregation and condensation protein B